MECGADAVINTGTIPLKEAVKRIFGNEKADVIIDCAGVLSVFYSILEAARPDSDIVTYLSEEKRLKYIEKSAFSDHC